MAVGIGAGISEEIEQVTAGKAGGARDQRHAGHRITSTTGFAEIAEHASLCAYLGTPLSAPLNGEKLPRPASVNDMKNRWSAGIATALPAPKW